MKSNVHAVNIQRMHAVVVGYSPFSAENDSFVLFFFNFQPTYLISD